MTDRRFPPSLTINRSDLKHTMMGAKTLEAQIADGTAKVEGDAGHPEATRFDHDRSTHALRSCPARKRGKRRWPPILDMWNPERWEKPIPTRLFRARQLRNSNSPWRGIIKLQTRDCRLWVKAGRSRCEPRSPALRLQADQRWAYGCRFRVPDARKGITAKAFLTACLCKGRSCCRSQLAPLLVAQPAS
jgi:hypothetical protein